MDGMDYFYLVLVTGAFVVFGAALFYVTEAEAHATRRAARKSDRPH